VSADGVAVVGGWVGPGVARADNSLLLTCVAQWHQPGAAATHVRACGWYQI